MKRMTCNRIPAAAGAAAIAAIIVLLAAVTASAQTGVSRVSLPLVVTNNHGASVSLLAGVCETATNGIDGGLGEFELPPVPPAEIFDARFASIAPSIVLGEGSPVDYRPWRTSPTAFTETYRIAYQAGVAAQTVTVLLPSSLGALVKQVKISNRAVSGGDSVVTTASSGTLTVTVDYDLQPVTFALNPAAVSFAISRADSTVPQPRQVQVTPSVTGAAWTAETDDGWLSVDPARGTGAGTVAIGLANLGFAGGRTTGTVRVFNARDDEPAVITVTVDMLTGIDDPASASSPCIAAVYPNPLRAAAGTVTIELALPATGPVSAVVVDLLGRHVATLCEGRLMEAGRRALRWDAATARIAPGAYVCRVTTAAGTAARMIVVGR